jgi:hypothetical protein
LLVSRFSGVYHICLRQYTALMRRRRSGHIVMNRIYVVLSNCVNIMRIVICNCNTFRYLDAFTALSHVANNMYGGKSLRGLMQKPLDRCVFSTDYYIGSFITLFYFVLLGFPPKVMIQQNFPEILSTTSFSYTLYMIHYISILLPSPRYEKCIQTLLVRSNLHL